jgi:hypothetical protein
MTNSQAVRYQANVLRDLMGQRAEAAAAARAAREREAGHKEEARLWQQVRQVLRNGRAPRQT